MLLWCPGLVPEAQPGLLVTKRLSLRLEVRKRRTDTVLPGEGVREGGRLDRLHRYLKHSREGLRLGPRYWESGRLVWGPRLTVLEATGPDWGLVSRWQRDRPRRETHTARHRDANTSWTTQVTMRGNQRIRVVLWRQEGEKRRSTWVGFRAIWSFGLV